MDGRLENDSVPSFFYHRVNQIMKASIKTYNPSDVPQKQHSALLSCLQHIIDIPLMKHIFSQFMFTYIVVTIQIVWCLRIKSHDV